MSDYGKMTDEQLICNLRAGEQEITDYVMDKYKFLVKKKAKEMYLLGGENDDLIQEGMIGLFKAVRDYDSEQGTPFCKFCGSLHIKTDVQCNQSVSEAETYAVELLYFPVRAGRGYTRRKTAASDRDDSDNERQ